ncbi:MULTISPECIES: hypothetical protein [Mycolicibacter]|uniref:hypothetical protein n=1 Tax=Mycolicibacter TaxID=1073531 RepID=UPI0013F4C078|nr:MULTISPECIES: hypothetical protein [Mycolicibacter]ULP49458.1 hypothetical protein MJO54_10715 [Mycolicibacter virginiensis]
MPFPSPSSIYADEARQLVADLVAAAVEMNALPGDDGGGVGQRGAGSAPHPPRR